MPVSPARPPPDDLSSESLRPGLGKRRRREGPSFGWAVASQSGPNSYTVSSRSPALVAGGLEWTPEWTTQHRHGILHVHAHRRLGDQGSSEKLAQELQVMLRRTGPSARIALLDVSENPLGSIQLRLLFRAVQGVPVERLCLSGITDNSLPGLLAHWLRSVEPAPVELDASHCQLNTGDFERMAAAVEANGAFPFIDPRRQCLRPLLLHLDYNYIRVGPLVARMASGMLQPCHWQSGKLVAPPPERGTKIWLFTRQAEGCKDFILPSALPNAGAPAPEVGTRSKARPTKAAVLAAKAQPTPELAAQAAVAASARIMAKTPPWKATWGALPPPPGAKEASASTAQVAPALAAAAWGALPPLSLCKGAPAKAAPAAAEARPAAVAAPAKVALVPARLVGAPVTTPAEVILFSAKASTRVDKIDEDKEVWGLFLDLEEQALEDRRMNDEADRKAGLQVEPSELRDQGEKDASKEGEEDVAIYPEVPDACLRWDESCSDEEREQYTSVSTDPYMDA